MAGQVVDTESAREFMKEALSRISEQETAAIVGELREKSRRFRAHLRGDLDEASLRALLRGVFSTRRSANTVIEKNPSLRDRIRALVRGDGSTAARFREFCDSLDGVDDSVRFDLASEILHYDEPDEYWLWTRWM